MPICEGCREGDRVTRGDREDDRRDNGQAVRELQLIYHKIEEEVREWEVGKENPEAHAAIRAEEACEGCSGHTNRAGVICRMGKEKDENSVKDRIIHVEAAIEEVQAKEGCRKRDAGDRTAPIGLSAEQFFPVMHAVSEEEEILPEEGGMDGRIRKGNRGQEKACRGKSE